MPDLRRMIVISPALSSPASFLRELVQSRELLLFLVWRDIKVRYKQTALGIVWAILQPLLTAFAFAVLFGHFAHLRSDGRPYLLLVFCGYLPWQVFSHAINEASNSVVENQRLITKVYFSRLVIPFSVVLAGLVDFAAGFVLLLVMMIFYGVVPTVTVLYAPFLLFGIVIAGLGISLWLSALNVQYRDVRYTLPFLTQLWFAATPVAYSSSIVPEQWQWLLALNPIAGFVQGFRWALLGGQPMPARMLAVSSCMALLSLVTGFWYFHRRESDFADAI